jgi:CheY-like chemotaxis protein
MPDMTGYEVARTLRQQLWARSTRLIALTGWGQQVDKDLAQAAGFDLHLTKPADPEAVLAGLAEACAEGA